MSRFVPIPVVLAVLLAAAVAPAGAATPSDADLAAAREELRLRVETERRMRRDFEALLAGGRMTAVEIADFERYLADLGALVDAQRRAVARLEGAEVVAEAPATLPESFDRGQTDEEKIAMLDAELGSSLSSFDEKLLREQEELAEKSRAASTGDSAAGEDGREAGSGEDGGGRGEGEGGGARADGRAGEGAGESGGASTDGGERRAGAPADRESGPDSGTDGGGEGAGGEQVASAGGAGDAGAHQGETRVPPDIPDGKDDDIVARQLREAAENEQDPELREKLWDEYRRYKASTR